jgi:hypothetical protein
VSISECKNKENVNYVNKYLIIKYFSALRKEGHSALVTT